MDRGKFATDIYWIFLYPSSLQASRKKGGKQAGKKKKDFGQLFTEKREIPCLHKSSVSWFLQSVKLTCFLFELKQAVILLSLDQWS